ncbi:hypothetical protein PCLA_07r0352 [Pseudomonas citronellolis]|nr:hypothetical protein PCLA_07r0352 [Pseudomonas citronellolis]
MQCVRYGLHGKYSRARKSYEDRRFARAIKPATAAVCTPPQAARAV